MNQPYVKQYDEEGNVTNPIEGKYSSKQLIQIPDGKGGVENTYYPNRHERAFRTRPNCRAWTPGRERKRQLLLNHVAILNLKKSKND